MRLVAGSALTGADRAQAQAIYEDGFPEEWLRSPFDELFEDEVLVLVDEDGTPLGLTVVRALGTTGWTFVRYFVAGVRGQGVGSRLWEALAQNRIGHGDTRVLLDVEDPADDGIDDEEAALRRRRIVFYERLGLVELPVQGYAPPHDGGAHPLRLMLADLIAGGPATVPEPRDLRAVVVAVFEHRYGHGPTDGVVREALAASRL